MSFFIAVFVFLGVCICGGLGAVARFVLDTAVKIVWKNAFPLSTLVINIIASFLAGMAGAAAAASTFSDPWHLMAVTGFLGGLSTFSTAINEVVSLGRDKRMSMAGYYLIACTVVPVLCAALGWQLVR
ncbi:CrcB family protein [Bifidobacterium sp. 82T24]|uniref:fluoride efflux transporter FluC n=1 Tax=Bifidobacterium pluvialisilvae TaxID=2834436 RepID=UPI001C56E8E6|nr:CrcB family protein [Bifidobacterium pluvialisilvae]MBW3088563.1 CrcB family protein [Bifidobacterium pluvialisilvae]